MLNLKVANNDWPIVDQALHLAYCKAVGNSANAKFDNKVAEYRKWQNKAAEIRAVLENLRAQRADQMTLGDILQDATQA